MRQKAVKPRCQYSLLKRASCASSRFTFWGNPLAWQCCAGPSGGYGVCRSRSPDTGHRMWPWTVGSQRSSWSIPLAIPKKGEADLTRWIPWAGNPVGLHRSHHVRKGQQQTQASLTLPLLRGVVEEPLASSKGTLWYNRRHFADASSLLLSKPPGENQAQLKRAGMAIANMWLFQHFNVYISLSKVSWDLAKRGKGAKELRAQAKTKSRPVLAADDHTVFDTAGYSRESSGRAEHSSSEQPSVLQWSIWMQMLFCPGKKIHLTNLNMLPQRENYLLLMILLVLFFSTDWGD